MVSDNNTKEIIKYYPVKAPENLIKEFKIKAASEGYSAQEAIVRLMKIYVED